MYNVVQEIVSSGVLFRAVTGSIFEAENNLAEGVAIFVMCGLTAFRPNARDYIKTLGTQTGWANRLAVFSKHTARGDITFLYDENRDNKIYDIGELHAIVDRTLNFFAERGVGRVAMNGIRVKSIISHEHFAEASLLAAVKNWCSEYEGAFESIDLVDKRGGFGVIMASDALRIVENNEIIEHVEAIRTIVERKCRSCDPGINGCMGCLFDSIDRRMIPAALDRILDLMHHMPNDRHDIIAAGRERHAQREHAGLVPEDAR